MTFGADLVALERQGWAALADGRGGEYYRENLTDGALMAFSFGLMDRQAAIAAMEQAPPWATFELIDPRVIEWTGQEPYSAMISSTFGRRDGRWLLAFHQQTPA